MSAEETYSIGTPAKRHSEQADTSSFHNILTPTLDVKEISSRKQEGEREQKANAGPVTLRKLCSESITRKYPELVPIQKHRERNIIQELAKLIIVSLFTIAHKKIPFEKLLDYATSFFGKKRILVSTRYCALVVFEQQEQADEMMAIGKESLEEAGLEAKRLKEDQDNEPTFSLEDKENQVLNKLKTTEKYAKSNKG